jgi:hypothetical protein
VLLGGDTLTGPPARLGGGWGLADGDVSLGGDAGAGAKSLPSSVSRLGMGVWTRVAEVLRPGGRAGAGASERTPELAPGHLCGIGEPRVSLRASCNRRAGW